MLIILNKRCRDILLLLLKSEAPLASAEIAQQMDITSRMVRYDLHTVEAWLEEHDIQLIKKSGFGILVDASLLVRKNLLKELEQSSSHSLALSPIERSHLIKFSLLTSEDSIPVKQLVLQLNVSRTSVLTDLDTVEEWLNKNHLHLIKRPHYGCQVTGKEYIRQEVLADFLLDNANQTHLLALFGENKNKIHSSNNDEIGLELSIQNFIDSLEIDYCRKMISSTENKLGLRLVDSAYVALILQVAILIHRIKTGHRINESPDCFPILTKKQGYTAIEFIREDIENHFGFVLNESEVAHIAVQLLTSETKRPITDLNEGKADPNECMPEVYKIVDEFLARASLYLHPSLRVDQLLITNLASHITLLKERLQLDHPKRNPLYYDGEKQFPYIFKVTRESCIILENELGYSIPEGEIGYIAMYLVAAMERLRIAVRVKRKVLVVCNRGIATVWLLVSRLRAEFPEIEIKGAISAMELQQMENFDNIDLIVCTIPVDIDNIPAIVVNPFLASEDIEKLKTLLEPGSIIHAQEEADIDPDMNGPSLSDLITTEMISLDGDIKNWQGVIDGAGKLLYNSGSIESRYIQVMKDTIQESGPYVVAWPGVALLHARPEDGVRKLCISLVVLKHPVNFGHPENDPVHLAFALGAVDDRSHRRVLLDLQNLFTNPTAVDEICKSLSPKHVLHVIKKYSSRE